MPKHLTNSRADRLSKPRAVHACSCTEYHQHASVLVQCTPPTKGEHQPPSLPTTRDLQPSITPQGARPQGSCLTYSWHTYSWIVLEGDGFHHTQVSVTSTSINWASTLSMHHACGAASCSPASPRVPRPCKTMQGPHHVQEPSSTDAPARCRVPAWLRWHACGSFGAIWSTDPTAASTCPTCVVECLG